MLCVTASSQTEWTSHHNVAHIQNKYEHTHTHTFRQTDPQKLNNDSDTRTHLSDDYIQRNSTHNVKTVSLQLHYQEHSVSQRYY